MHRVLYEQPLMCGSAGGREGVLWMEKRVVATDIFTGLTGSRELINTRAAGEGGGRKHPKNLYLVFPGGWKGGGGGVEILGEILKADREQKTFSGSGWIFDGRKEGGV